MDDSLEEGIQYHSKNWRLWYILFKFCGKKVLKRGLVKR